MNVLTMPMVQVGSVDMVLSSLTSPGMVAASAAVLRRGGCFVELGKRCGLHCSKEDVTLQRMRGPRLHSDQVLFAKT